MIPSYIEFTTKYPALGVAPYVEQDVTDRLEEVSLSFPQIVGCLPEDTHMLATYYAFRYLAELEECESPVPIKMIHSRNDTIQYALAGDGNILGNTTWGSKLLRLFKTHGCFHRAWGSGGCGNCGCTGGCGCC